MSKASRPGDRRCSMFSRLNIEQTLVMVTKRELDAHIRLLAEEYIVLVDAMRQGQYTDAAEWQLLSGQRSLVHDELIVLTGLLDRPAMYAYCRELMITPTPD